MIGAGAAGLAAGRVLADRGASFLVLEARSRAGGRAWTDEETFPGLPFDRGCHWLHSGSINPLREIADQLGFAYAQRSGFRESVVFVGERPIAEPELNAYVDEVEDAYRQIHDAAAAGKDISASDAILRRGRWHPLFQEFFAGFYAGDPHEVSCQDLCRLERADGDYPVEAGYGALIAAHSRKVPVELATPVTRVEWSGHGVRIETPRGSIRAKAAIVTASTSVLAAGQIRFVPTLPVPLLEAIEACRLGCVEKIVFRLDRPVDEGGDGTYMTFMDKDGEGPLHPLWFYVNPFGRPLLVAFVGGTFGRELIMAGEKEAISFTREVLAKCFGSDFPRRITGATATGWLTDPYIRGGFSFARPGKADLRARLAEPVGERLFFAGEAVSPNFYAAAHGAHLTGIAAAERALCIV